MNPQFGACIHYLGSTLGLQFTHRAKHVLGNISRECNMDGIYHRLVIMDYVGVYTGHIMPTPPTSPLTHAMREPQVSGLKQPTHNSP